MGVSGVESLSKGFSGFIDTGGRKEVLTGFAEGSTGGFPGTDAGENQAGTLERDAVFEIEGAGVCGVMSTSKGLNAKTFPLVGRGPPENMILEEELE